MQIINRFSESDAARSQTVKATPHMLARAHAAVVEAADLFATSFVTPVVSQTISPRIRERAFIGLYYRLVLLCRSAQVLNTAAHFQSLSAAARLGTELYIDALVLHRNLIPDAAVECGGHAVRRVVGNL